MNTQKIIDIRDRVLSGGAPTHGEAVELLGLEGSGVSDLMAAAAHVREKFKGNRVHLCAIVNAKSGNCPEDCGFCAQSLHNHAEIATFPMLSVDAILAAAKEAASMGARCFGIVTSGRSLDAHDVDVVCEAARRIRRELRVNPSASLGVLTEPMAQALKEAGLYGYHHNVETARSYYPNVCSTHTWEENIATLRLARKFGFHVCSGGLFGIGESPAQRVEMAEELAAEDIERVCLNFFLPIKNTRFEGLSAMRPAEILKTIAVFRLFHPARDINICAGRGVHLRDAQSLIFNAGASAMMVGNYLTQPGRRPEDDHQMLRDLDLDWR